MKEVKKPTSRRNLDRFCSLVTLLRSLAYAIATPTRGAQQLVLPLAPLAQLGSLDGVATQVQKHLGFLVEALAGKGSDPSAAHAPSAKSFQLDGSRESSPSSLICNTCGLPAAQSSSSSFSTVKRIWWERLLLTMAEA